SAATFTAGDVSFLPRPAGRSGCVTTRVMSHSFDAARRRSAGTANSGVPMYITRDFMRISPCSRCGSGVALLYTRRWANGPYCEPPYWPEPHMPFESATLTIMSRTPALFQQQDSLTFDQPVGDLPVVDDARWSAALTGNSWGAFMAWIVLLIVLHAVSWPIARRTFTRLPDRGWAFSRLITLLVAGYAVWLFSSMHLISFRAIWGAVAIAGLGAISLILRRRVPLREREAPIYRNSIAMSAEIIFWVVFAVFLLFRLINPDSYHPYWGGEKAMEFAHINSILRSAHFPPIDPWYAGGFINYYYYGT